MPWIDGDGRADRAMSVTADKYRNSLLVDLRPNATEHLRLLDEARIVLDGGDHDRGYVYGFRRIDADDWYFNCHFYRDPVMPGSLGIEAIIQALQLFILESGSASHLREPVFHCPIDVEMTWKYRGQVLREDGEISLEVHVKEVRSSPEKVVAIADASLWKPGMRIYETNDVAIEVREGQPR
jgi:3-hydroxymyristoyl/3-hydroxydecanoyl-(acyl carrier protein) dehydratase